MILQHWEENGQLKTRNRPVTVEGNTGGLKIALTPYYSAPLRVIDTDYETYEIRQGDYRGGCIFIGARKPLY